MDKKVLIQDLSDGLVRRKGVSKTDAEIFVRTVFDMVGEFLQSDKIVKIKGLGTFKLVTVDSRESVDVNTGERIVIKEYTKVNFTPDPVLRDAVNKPFAQFETVVLNEGTSLEDMERMDDDDVERIYKAGLNEGRPMEENHEAEPDDFRDRKRGEVESVAESVADEGTLPIETASIEERPEDAEDAVEEKKEVPDLVMEEPNAVAQDEVESMQKTGMADEHVDETEGKAQESSVESGEAQKTLKSEENERGVETASEFESTEQEPFESCGTQEEEQLEQHVQHVSHVHVSSQQIEVQKVEHQKVEHQHIVQVTPERGRYRVYLTPWMMFFLVLLVLFLMSVSYYAGYQQHFGAGETHKLAADKSVESVTDMKSGQNAPSRKQAADSLKAEADTLVGRDGIVRTDTGRVTVKEKTSLQPKVEYPQVKGGAYEIVGIQERHRMRSGETLRGLALKYYGSKDFTVYLVVQNKITNPDVVPEGMWLEIPKLRLKRR